MTYALILMVAAWIAAELLAWLCRLDEASCDPAPPPPPPRNRISLVGLDELLGDAIRRRTEATDIVFVAAGVGAERYVFIAEDTPENRQALINTATRFAADPDLNFTATAAAAVANQLRERCT